MDCAIVTTAPRANFAVIVSFTLKSGARDRFLTLVGENAGLSVEREPLCYRFDVLEPAGQPDTVVLYEIYADSAAFDLHLASAHFLSFNAATADLVAAKQVTRYSLTETGEP